jgi:hypothetical protein
MHDVKIRKYWVCACNLFQQEFVGLLLAFVLVIENKIYRVYAFLVVIKLIMAACI